MAININDFITPTIPGTASGEIHNNALSFIQQGNINNKKATIFLFPPKHISDQYRRSHKYNFNSKFMEKVNNTIESTARRNLNINLSSFMGNDPESLGGVIPTIQGTPINTNWLRNVYTFILIIDNDKYSNGLISTPNNINTRTILSGYCTNEPMSKGINGQMPVPNPQCVLTITHYTTINDYNSQQHVMSLADTVPAQQSSMSYHDTNLFNLNPIHTTDAVTVDEFSGNCTVNPASGYIQPGNYNPILSSELSSPRHHLHRIVSGLQETILHSSPLANDEDWLSRVGTGTNDKINQFSNQISYAVAAPICSIKVDEPILFVNIINKYPNIEINNFDMPYNNGLDLSNQGYANEINVANAILSSSLPYLLSFSKLASISFRYNSAGNPNGIVFDNRGVDQCLHISSMYPCSNDRLVSIYKNFIDRLKFLIFPMIMNIGGHFDVMVQCSLSGSTLIDLRFLDNINVFNGYHETSNIFNSITSPLTGNAADFEHNAMELYKLTSSILEVPAQYLNQLITDNNIVPSTITPVPTGNVPHNLLSAIGNNSNTSLQGKLTMEDIFNK